MITILFIVISVIFSISAFSNPDIFNRLKFNAYRIYHDKEWYRFLSYGLIHADWGHLLINMWVLYSFGRIVEAFYENFYGISGRLFYIALYLSAIIVSTIYDYIKQKDNPYYNAIGASGAVSAVVFASIIFYPMGKIYLFFIPIGIPAPVFGILYLIYSAYMAKNANDNIGHSAHFFGAVFGLLYVIITVPHALSNFVENIF